MFVRRCLCHTSCFSVFFAEKAYINIPSHILKVKCMHGHFNFCINLSPIVNLLIFSWHDAISTTFNLAKIQGVFKQFPTKSSFQAPLKSKIKFQGFSSTSRSSTNHAPRSPWVKGDIYGKSSIIHSQFVKKKGKGALIDSNSPFPSCCMPQFQNES